MQRLSFSVSILASVIHESTEEHVVAQVLRCILPQTRILINVHMLYHLAWSTLLVRLARKIVSFMLVHERVLDISSLLSSVDVSRITNPSPSYPTIPRNEESGNAEYVYMHLHVYVLVIKMGRRRWSRLSSLSLLWSEKRQRPMIRFGSGIRNSDGTVEILPHKNQMFSLLVTLQYHRFMSCLI